MKSVITSASASTAPSKPDKISSPHFQRLNFLSLTPRPVESFLLVSDPIDGERFNLPEPVREAA